MIFLVMGMKQLRQKAGLRAEEVAAQIGVAHSSIRNWEQGRTIPKLRVDQVALLCRIYSCSIDDLEQAVKESTANYEKAV
jgi:putative transcriptional regulator